ncbi:MAG: hypothetical protein IKV28_05355 [Bacteroidales bacterium]|nr:hypothetical protein [Bacteroidales bacterium]
MEDCNGADHQATQMNGRIYTVDYIDDAGQIHLQGSGLAVIPNVDRFVKVDCATRFDKKMSEIYDMIEDYFRFNDDVESDDGFYITKNGEAHLTSQQEIRGEGEFYPIDSLIRHTFAGYAPDVDKIKQMVRKYFDEGKESISGR